jgi:hypothetical protein
MRAAGGIRKVGVGQTTAFAKRWKAIRIPMDLDFTVQWIGRENAMYCAVCAEAERAEASELAAKHL